jgi:hypothetical protein
MASKRHQRKKACDGKKRHDTFLAAAKAAEVMRDRHYSVLRLNYGNGETESPYQPPTLSF